MLILSSASYQYYAKIQIFQKEKFGMFVLYSKVLFLEKKMYQSSHGKYSADCYP